MTNYNEKIDKIFSKTKQVVTTNYSELSGWSAMAHIELTDKAKQALTSLIKELVAEAKPKNNWLEGSDLFYGQDEGVGDFEQNLLKALEEN